ncbi:thioredoxin family protein [Roseateles sp. SL47]|uniref:protein-disulfide reductase DsbD family protein n=1 Tax=Roseateles sp. SL47 TaxID=2995138 RepID=UPI00226FB47C|nr:thioredoxin family protein [Roseateles sp. SL47]WAC75851.1 thioredoxin family protein [Roseateles sp. SL47]
MRISSLVTLASVTAALIFLAPVCVQAQVKASLVAAAESVQPSRAITVALRLEHEPHWHSYWLNPGTGYPTTLQWNLPDGWKATGFNWPTPSLIKDKKGDITGYGYDGVIYLPLTVSAPAMAKVGEQVTLRAKANWLMCNDVCVPGSDEVSVTLPVVATEPIVNAAVQSELAKLEMPRKPEGWSLVASRGKGTVELTIAGQQVAGITSPHFISADGYIKYDKAQETSNGDTLRMLLPIDDEAPLSAAKLVGVLTYTDEKGRYRGVSVGVPFGPPGVTVPSGAVQADAALASEPDDRPSATFAQTSASEGASAAQAKSSEAPAAAGALIFVLAFAGGLILNLMPCVFPVLGIKILGFVNEAGNDRRKVTMHGVMFTLGVLLSFWVLASALALLRASGQQLGWGFQLQSAPFVFGLTVVMLIFGMSLSGVFEFGLSATGVGSGLQQRSGVHGSFFAGILATVVATPCSAPFLAPALGAALTLPIVQSFGVFTVIGLGLSAPYLLLALFPKTVQRLPRPGAWMNTFKQAMAFPLYATVAYLVWVLAGQTTESGLLTVLLGLTVVALAVWLYGHYQHPGTSPGRARAFTAMSVALLALGWGMGWPRPQSPNELVWENWSPERVAQLRMEGRPVYLDFTARWCATCQANKKLVFSSSEMKDYVRDHKVALLRADWTNADPRITAELAKWKRGAVPFNLVYGSKHAEPVILPEVLTPEIVLRAFKN